FAELGRVLVFVGNSGVGKSSFIHLIQLILSVDLISLFSPAPSCNHHVLLPPLQVLITR
uniref:Uncharacterized protein n=1 Tax=Terrapene triunguis TaxID=2587831 RepID=A0A674IVV7_9SAUR